MMRYYKRAIQDIFNHRFLNVITVITIGLSILIVSACYLFFINAAEVMNAWKKGLRIMVYLEPDVDEAVRADLARRIRGLYGVRDLKFVSKSEAFAYLKSQMKHQASLLEDLAENPLPDAFEIRMIASTQSMGKIEELAAHLESLDSVDTVEYGKKWLGRFSNIFNMFKFVGYALGGIFLWQPYLSWPTPCVWYSIPGGKKSKSCALWEPQTGSSRRRFIWKD